MKNILKKLFCIHQWKLTVDEKVYQLAPGGRKVAAGTNKVWICKECGDMKMYHY